MPKIILLAGNAASTSIVYNYLCQYFTIEAVIIESRAPLLEFIRKRIHRLGFGKVFGQILFTQMIVKLQTFMSAGRIKAIQQASNFNNAVIDPQKIIQVPSVNSPDTINILKKIDPQVVVVYGTRIIDGKVLNSIAAKFVNMHAGITPLYRGVHGGYWALAQRDSKNCGVTIHLVDTGIDTGAILGQDLIFPEQQDCFVTYPYLQLSTGLPILKSAIQDILNNHYKIKSGRVGKSQFWTHPTILEYLWYRIRYGVR